MKKIFIGVLIFRLIISFLPPMSIDMGAWQAWAMRMVEVGPQNFYSTKIFTDNPPGYLYIFWVIGAVREYLINWSNLTNWLNGGGFAWLLKLPGNLFDLGTGLLIYKIISHKRGGLSWLGLDLAKLGFLLYTLNPAIWFNSSVFGQFDGAGAFFGLLAVYLLLEKKRSGFSAAALAIAWAVKPQAIALAPGIGILALRESFSRWNLAKARFHLLKLGVGFLGTILLLYWPFFPNNPLAGVFYIFSRMNNIYSCTTCYAFNFWGIFGNWLDDRVLFLGLPFLIWGIILGGLGMLGILIFVGAHHDAPVSIHNTGRIYLAIALSVMAFFMFVTRMHERYLLPFFAFFLISVILSKSKFLMLCYLVISGLSLLNVYYPYANYNTDLHLTPWLVLWLGEHFKALSAMGFGSFLILWWWYLKEKKWEARRGKLETEVRNGKRDIKKSNFSFQYLTSHIPHLASDLEIKNIPWTKKEIVLVFALIFISFIVRVIRLDIPKTYYFDEVYHAFTAEAYARNDPRGYEWWNTPPAGFAYEWLHPPLAKLLQAGSIKILGDKAFAWRLPGVIFASLTVLLLYLFGRSLFGSKRVGFLAAFFYAFDGLSFAQSRITMNDIYIAFFILLSFYLFWEYWQGRRKLIWTGVALGLAVSTKWTGFYAIPILGGLYLLNSASGFSRSLTKLIARFILIFVIIPLIIYFLSYFQFWLQGHTWAQFQELHNQIWLYQTNLKATHPYQSGALSWPLMQRPVWYYVDYGISQISPIGQIGGPTIANLYAMGNPMVWWAGLLAVGFAIMEIIKYLLLKWEMRGGKLETEVRSEKSRNLISRLKIQLLTSHLSPLPVVFILSGYFGFFLPWALSPRIMFLYHYLPSLPFLFLALGYGLEKISQIGLIGQMGKIQITGKMLTTLYLILATLAFVYFYPQLSALPVSKEWSEQYFWFASWR